ncbi:MAG: hypothetical protein P4M11_03985 [Candidatus Pacebacteria bacterium]|nr:hypothetical protein [Candidatus Paceibacterota bacterium]
MYKNLMKNAMRHAAVEPNNAGIYTFMSTAPTMTNTRIEALGTGSQPPYIKIAQGFGRDKVTSELS